MGIAAYKLVFAAKIVGRVNGVMMKAEDLDNLSIEVTIPDDVVESSSAVLPEESTVDESTIEILMEQTSCTRDDALNALLSHDKNLDEALAFIQVSFETMTVSDNSSVPPISRPTLPSGRRWGEQSEINISSQMNDTISSEETVVVTVTTGCPGTHGTMWIDFEKDGVTFHRCGFIWAHINTSPPLHKYHFKKYRFMKVNERSVNNEDEFRGAISSLNEGDPLTFTLAKGLFSQGDVYSQFFTACRSGDTGIVKRLVESNPEMDINKGLEGADVDLKKIYGNYICEGSTPLHVACVHGNLSVIDELFNYPGIDVNKGDSSDRSPLHIVIKNKQPEAMRRLLTHPNTDVNKRDGVDEMLRYETRHETPLCCVCWEDNLDAVKQLIAHPNIEVNAKDGFDKTALMTACLFGHSSIVQCLLALPQIDTTATDYKGKTALYIASEEGHEEIVKMLLTHPQIDTTATDKYGNTALYIASEEGHEEIVKMLKEHEEKSSKQEKGRNCVIS